MCDSDTANAGVTAKVKFYKKGTARVTTSGGEKVSTGTALSGDDLRFGGYFSDIDQDVELVKINEDNIETGYMVIGEAVSRANGHHDQDGNPTEGERLKVSYEADSGRYVFARSHYCRDMDGTDDKPTGSDAEMAYVAKAGLKLTWVGRDCGTTFGMFSAKVPSHTVSVKKFDAETEGTRDKLKVPTGYADYYSLEGAEFGVYETDADAEADSNRVGTLTTNDSGETNELALEAGIYYIKETKASPGHDLNTGIFFVDVTTRGVTVDIEEPIRTVPLSLKKASANPSITDDNELYSLKGAKFGVYASLSDANSQNDPVTTLTTDANGETEAVELLAGTYYVKETERSPGYAKNPSAVKVALTLDSDNPPVEITEPPKADDVTVSVAKLAAEAGKTYNMAGARFKIEYYNAHLTAGQTSVGRMREFLQRWLALPSERGAPLRAVERADVDTLVLEQLHLHVDAAAEAGQAAVASDYAVARRDDAERVVADRPAHGAGRLAPAGFAFEALGDGAVSGRLAVGDVEHGLSNAQLEGRGARRERQLARVGCASREVAVEPCACPVEDRQVVPRLHRAVDAVAVVAVVPEPAAHDGLAVARDGERADEVGLILGAIGSHVGPFRSNACWAYSASEFHRPMTA